MRDRIRAKYGTALAVDIFVSEARSSLIYIFVSDARSPLIYIFVSDARSPLIHIFVSNVRSSLILTKGLVLTKELCQRTRSWVLPTRVYELCSFDQLVSRWTFE